MKTEILEVTPAMAFEMLSKQLGNRKINRRQVDMLVCAIKNGEWRLTHQGIAFYEDGTLADGQHRLTAISESGESVSLMVVTGVKRDLDTVLAVDCGKPRTVIDSNFISGVEVSNKAISLAKGIEYSFGGNRKKLSHKQSFELVKKHEATIKTTFNVFGGSAKRITIVPVRSGVARAVVYGVNHEFLREFCETLMTGIYSKPIMVNAVRLRNKLLDENYNTGGLQEKAHRMTLNVILKTYNNEEVKRIVV
jgi:hypothetical protein